MNKNCCKSPELSRHRFRFEALLFAALLMLITLLPGVAWAESAKWNQHPVDNDWNTGDNWTPTTVPDQPGDTAAFGFSEVTHISIVDGFTIAEIKFLSSANNYDIDIEPGAFSNIRLTGRGITNNSSGTQSFITSEGLSLGDRASINGDVVITSRGGGTIFFDTDASAGEATLVNEGATQQGNGSEGNTVFLNRSSASESMISNNPPQIEGDNGGTTIFYEFSTAANSSITSIGGGFTIFELDSTAANAILMSESGGVIDFEDNTTGGTARIILSDEGIFDMTLHNESLLTIGSLEGDGTVYLAGRNLGVGSNGLDTTFSGLIREDGGFAGGHLATLTKVGSGTFTLAGANLYTGGTTVEEGTLLVQTANGSATGTGPVQINAGTFGGRSNILGAVTVGTGSGTGAFLAPGIKGPGVLVIRNTLTFKADGTYACELNIPTRQADQVIAKGVTIESGAQFAFSAKGNQPLPIGTVFTVIDNRSAQPISGTFANLPDNSTFSANGNTFQVSYEGGNGNDLTLTVAP